MKWLTVLILVLSSTLVRAENEGLTVPHNAKWKDECSSCHLAYPPQLLTADSWQQVMNKLDKHFGANATMEANDAKDIQVFLQRHAGSGSRHSAASLRITDTTWFKRTHRELPNGAWSNPLVKTASNCSACHVKAERGDWSERGVRMPGGLRIKEDD